MTQAAARDFTAALPPEAFYKTRLCRFHTAFSVCRLGGACLFAHGYEELRVPLNLYRTRPCTQFVQTGTCSDGGNCRYAHCKEDLRPSPALERAAESRQPRGVGTCAPRRGGRVPAPQPQQPTAEPLRAAGGGGQHEEASGGEAGGTRIGCALGLFGAPRPSDQLAGGQTGACSASGGTSRPQAAPGSRPLH